MNSKHSVQLKAARAYTAAQCLRAMTDRDNGRPPSMRELAVELRVNASTAHRRLEDALKLGLVERMAQAAWGRWRVSDSGRTRLDEYFQGGDLV